jgi:hypothetical protein
MIVKSDGHLNGDMPRYFDWNENASRVSGWRNQRRRSPSTVSLGRRSGSERSMSRLRKQPKPWKGRWRIGLNASNLARFSAK